MKEALLIIDVQNDYFEGGKAPLHNPLQALNNVEKALAHFRKEGLPVIHVQHINTREEATFFLPNTEGAQIHKSLTPIEGEHTVVKHVPNSFLNTNLLTILEENGIKKLVICGMMSHMCVDTTVRACMDHGIKVTLLADACATKDLIFEGETIPAEMVQAAFMASLNGMFAKVVKTTEIFHRVG
jgi:nicotinamidase-related amidase